MLLEIVFESLQTDLAAQGSAEADEPLGLQCIWHKLLFGKELVDFVHDQNGLLQRRIRDALQLLLLDQEEAVARVYILQLPDKTKMSAYLVLEPRSRRAYYDFGVFVELL